MLPFNRAPQVGFTDVVLFYCFLGSEVFPLKSEDERIPPAVHRIE